MFTRIRTANPALAVDVDALLAFHRSVFGDARMEGDGAGDQDGGDDAGEPGGDGDGGDSDGDDDAPLGPAGEKALQAEKTKRREAQAQLREWKALGLTLAQIRELQSKATGGSGGGDQPDLEQVKATARAEAAAELTRDRVLDKIEAKGARLFTDPDDAAALLLRAHDHTDFLDDNGRIDVEAIEDALKELLEKKPYLGVAQGDGKRFKGGADGGARKEQKPKVTSLQDAVAARIAAGGS